MKSQFINNQKLAKLFAVTSFILISLFIITHFEVYPLRLLGDVGYLNQIPIYYWMFFSGSIASLFLINYYGNSPKVSLFTAVIYFLLLGSYHFLFRGTAGGGFSAERVEFSRINPFISAEIYGSGQFSQVPILNRIQYLIIETNYNLLDTVELGLFIYIVLFAISTWSFIYCSRRDPFTAFAGASVLFVIIFPLALRFRFVPQFFALILLIFLFTIHTRSGRNWFVLKVILFAALVHSHAMFFLYYLIPVLLYPLVLGFWSSIQQLTTHQIVAKSIVDIGTRPIRILKLSTSQTIRNYRDSNWVRYTSVLLSIYFLFFLFNFDRWQRRIFTFFSSPDLGGSAALLARYLGFDVQRELRYEPVPTELQYHLTSLELSVWITRMTIGIVLLGLALIAIGTLLRKTSSFHPFHLAIGLAAAIHFVGGILLPIHGRRALQVLFIPFVLSVVLLKRNTVTLVLVFLILVSSPVLVMNTLNNAELTGGDRQPDFYTEAAAETLEEVEYDVLIRQSSVNYKPVDIIGDRTHVGIREVLPGLEPRYGPRYTPERGDLILFDHRLEHKTRYFVHDCNYEQMNVILDNNNQILHIGDIEFHCEQQEPP